MEKTDRDDPVHRLERKDLGASLTRLSPESSRINVPVLVLSIVEQMDYESIAAALQIPIGTVALENQSGSAAPFARS